MGRFTRGFGGRARGEQTRRLPPGQYDVGEEWPVLSAEATPAISAEAWELSLDGLVARPTTWRFDELEALAPATYEGPIHCVTTWSKFDLTFSGVSLDTLFAIVEPLPEARFVLARAHTGYTTNLPLEDLTGNKAFIATRVNGELLAAEHGGPARLLVPHLYFWKSAKWIATLTLRAEDEPGFWERNGYHDRGDPWREQRYQGD